MSIERNDPILIIGSGAIGLSLAWELARRFQRVILLESDPTRHPPASWAGAGILPPGPVNASDDPLEQLKALSRSLNGHWSRLLLEETGMDSGFRQCGGIYLARTPGETATLVANQYWWDEHGISYRRLDQGLLVQEEPNLADFVRDHFCGAWLMPEEYQIRNPWLLKALRLACEKRGVQFLRETVSEIELAGSGQAQVKTESGRIFSDCRVCLCSGAWTRQFLEQMGIPSGIMPVRGQMVLYQADQPLIRRIVNEGNRYLVPRDDGRILAGSVEEEVGYDCRTTDSALQAIQQWAVSVLPLLSRTPIEKCWAGLRPGSFDGLPYLGLIPGSESVYVAAGHFRSGLHLASATATVMANEILGQPNSIDLYPLRAGRG